MNPELTARVLADVDAFCLALRPSEELCAVERRFNEETLPLAREHNLLGLLVPGEYGGRGCDAPTYLQALTRIGREGTGVRTFFSGHCSIGQYPILKFGTPAQRAQYLPRSVRGECLLAFALTEPEAGSNPLEMTTTYERTAEGYLLTGVKYLISNGSRANAFIAFGYPAAASGAERRMSAFIVDAVGETLERETLTAKPGMHTADTGVLQMTRHFVPRENLLGEEGAGFRVAMATLVSGRLSVAAGCLGVIEDCLAEALAYSRQRVQHGKPIARHQLVQEHLAAMELARSATSAIVAQAGTAKQQADDCPEDAALQAAADLLAAEAKLFASNAAWEAADRAVQVFGGRGWSELYRVGRHLQDVRVCRIYEGTDEILKLKIAAAILGKEYAAFG